MMHAVPKHQTWNDRFTFPRPCPGEYAGVFEALPAIAAGEERYIRCMNRCYAALRPRQGLDNVRLIFSNYTFRQPAENDAGDSAEAGNGAWFRLCVAIDGKGIPLTYRVVPRDLSPSGVRSLIDDIKAETEARKITLVAVGLRDFERLAQDMVEGANGFVLLAPEGGLPDRTGAWANAPEDYRMAHNQTHLIKSRVVRHSFLLGSGKEVAVKEIAFKSVQPDAKAFCVVSSETQLSEASIFNIYRELWRVHEPFQVTSADFISPPFPVDARTHLKAHFLICYTAFFALRVLRQEMNWEYNAASVADALSRMEGAYLDEGWFLFNYRTPVTDAIQKACGVEVARRLMSRGDVRAAIAATKRFVASKAR